jgi:hypothetical protein
LQAFQLESAHANPGGSSLIATVGVEAQRNSELVAFATMPALTSSFTLWASGIPFTVAASNSLLIGTDDGTTANSLQLGLNHAAPRVYSEAAGVVLNTSATVSVATIGMTFKAVASVSYGNNQTVAANATGLRALPQPAPMPAFTRMSLAQAGTGVNRQFDGYRPRIKIWLDLALDNNQCLLATV